MLGLAWLLRSLRTTAATAPQGQRRWPRDDCGCGGGCGHAVEHRPPRRGARGSAADAWLRGHVGCDNQRRSRTRNIFPVIFSPSYNTKYDNNPIGSLKSYSKVQNVRTKALTGGSVMGDERGPWTTRGASTTGAPGRGRGSRQRDSDDTLIGAAVDADAGRGGHPLPLLKWTALRRHAAVGGAHTPAQRARLPAARCGEIVLVLLAARTGAVLLLRGRRLRRAGEDTCARLPWRELRARGAGATRPQSGVLWLAWTKKPVGGTSAPRVRAGWGAVGWRDMAGSCAASAGCDALALTTSSQAGEQNFK